MIIDDITCFYRTYMQMRKCKNLKLHSEAELAEKISKLKPGEVLSVAIINGGDTDV